MLPKASESESDEESDGDSELSGDDGIDKNKKKLPGKQGNNNIVVNTGPKTNAN